MVVRRAFVVCGRDKGEGGTTGFCAVVGGDKGIMGQGVCEVDV